jgi:hypothetical protein
MESSEVIGFALGTVLAGFIFMAPAWGVSAVWNRFMPKRSINPWTFPLVVSVACTLLGLLGTGSTEYAEEAARYRPVLALGLMPAVIFCFFRRRAYGREAARAKLDL